MHRFVPAFVLLSAGCNGWPGEVYTIQVQPFDAPEVTSAIEHNYTGAILDQDEASDWTFTEEQSQSDEVLFMQIIDTDTKDVRLAVIGDRVFEGTPIEDGWEFRWTNSEDDSESQTHTSGFGFTTSTSVALEIIFQMAFKGDGEGTGTGTTVVTANQEWTESDQWDPNATDVYSTRVPSYNYLVGAEGQQVVNYPESGECDADPCRLAIANTGTTETSLTFFATDLEHEDFDGVSGAGQSAGVDL